MATTKKNNVLAITAKAAPTLTVNLVGKSYKVQAPKAALALDVARQANSSTDANPAEFMETVSRLIDAMFTPADSVKINARLRDARDLLDVDHLAELSNALMEHKSENPTT